MKKIFLIYISLGAIPVYSADADYPEYLTMENIGSLSLSNNVLDMDNNNAHLLQNELLNVDNDNPDLLQYSNFDYKHNDFDLSDLLLRPSDLQDTTASESAVLKTPYAKQKLNKKLKSSNHSLQVQASSSTAPYSIQPDQNDQEKEKEKEIRPKKSRKKLKNNNPPPIDPNLFEFNFNDDDASTPEEEPTSYSYNQASSSINPHKSQTSQENQEENISNIHPILTESESWKIKPNYYYKCGCGSNHRQDADAYRKHVQCKHKGHWDIIEDRKIKKMLKCQNCKKYDMNFDYFTKHHRKKCLGQFGQTSTLSTSHDPSDEGFSMFNVKVWDPNKNYYQCPCPIPPKNFTEYCDHIKKDHPEKEPALLEACNIPRPCICDAWIPHGYQGLIGHRSSCPKFKSPTFMQKNQSSNQPTQNTPENIEPLDSLL